MKPAITPTHREVVLDARDIIVSKTDTTGRITYVNRCFMRIANYSEDEVLTKQHNIVRHPDMPRGVFKLLWDTLKEGKEFFGYVKNLTSEGDYYWVFANITPDHDARGQVVGYFSVRRKPRPEAIAIVQQIYREMLAVEQKEGPARGPDASIALLAGKLQAMGASYEKFILSL